jgi:hypothetical protein
VLGGRRPAQALVDEAGHERQVVADQLELVGVVQQAQVSTMRLRSSAQNSTQSARQQQE